MRGRVRGEGLARRGVRGMRSVPALAWPCSCGVSVHWWAWVTCGAERSRYGAMLEVDGSVCSHRHFEVRFER